MKSIYAIIVLYRLTLVESPAYLALGQALAEQPQLAASLDLLVFDNSPAPQPLPPGFPGEYFHDPANPGLAKPYNAALRLAEAAGAAWLMLLDQDTAVTPEYLAEVLEQTALQEPRAEISALVPRLMDGPLLLSPHLPPFIASPSADLRSLRGIPPMRLQMFNSGAVLRVSSLVAIGGFPERYPLDYLDHATFHLLQVGGNSVFILHAALEHRLSSQEVAGETPARALRHNSILRSAGRFYREFGTPLELQSFRRDLFRQALLALRAGKLAPAQRLLRAAWRKG